MNLPGDRRVCPRRKPKDDDTVWLSGFYPPASPIWALPIAVESELTMTYEHTSTLPAPVMMDGELRIGDIALAETLGFATPVNIRKLIKRHADYLARFAVISTVEITSGVSGGRSGTEYFLTEEQASYIAMLSQTSKAAEGRINLILGFKAMKKELETRRAGATPDTALTTIADALAQLAQTMTAQNERIARLEERIGATVETVVSHRPSLAARVEKQGNLFGMADDPEVLAEFRPISAFLDLAPLVAKRRFLVAGRAAQSCAGWLMKHERGAFVRASRETGRLLFHPEGVEAWFAATGRSVA